MKMPDFFNDLLVTSESILLISPEDSHIEKICLKNNTTVFEEFLKFIYIWKDFGISAPKDYVEQYDRFINFIENPTDCIIAGSLILNHKVGLTRDVKYIETGDIDLFLSYSDGKELTIKELGLIFDYDLMQTMFLDYIKQEPILLDYLGKTKINKSIDASSSPLRQTSNSDYIGMSTDKNNEILIQTFQINISLFNFNIIQTLIPEMEPVSILLKDQDINIEWYFNFGNATHIQNSFDLENAKFIYDFYRKEIMHIDDFLIEKWVYFGHKFEEMGNNTDIDTEIRQHCLSIYRTYDYQLQHIQRTPFKTYRDSVVNNPEALILSKKTAGLIKDFDADISGLYYSIEKAMEIKYGASKDKNYSSEDILKTIHFEKKDFTKLYMSSILPRILKYIGRGYSFIDTYGALSLIELYAKLTSKLTSITFEINQMKNQSLLAMSRGSIIANKYSIEKLDYLEQQLKDKSIKDEKESNGTI